MLSSFKLNINWFYGLSNVVTFVHFYVWLKYSIQVLPGASFQPALLILPLLLLTLLLYYYTKNPYWPISS